jgi:hypothetical protein
MRRITRNRVAACLWKGLRTRVGARWVAVTLLVAVAALSSPPAGASTAPATTPSSGYAPATLPAADQSYWLAAANGGVYAFGGSTHFGTMAGHPLNGSIVGIASAPTGDGYWLVASDGGIFTYGAAQWHGSAGNIHLHSPVVGMAVDPATGGYWLVASDGGVFSFDAPFYGSMGGKPLARSVVGMAATPTGGGYWLVAADGGVFSFGNARYYGSLPGQHVTPYRPIVGMTASGTGHGYFLVASDGGIFTYGSVQFYGSLGGPGQLHPFVGVAAMFNDRGYWLSNTQGQVTGFGTAQTFGSITSGSTSPVVGIAVARGTGSSTIVYPPVMTSPPPSTSSSTSTYPPGSYGYDISKYQCGNLPGGTHTVGIVSVDSWGSLHPNPCFTTEASWAGSGLNLYMFMIYGTSSATEPGCSTAPVPSACNYGYAEAISDYDWARSQIGSRATVPWWLDVEGANWSGSGAANQSVLMGALHALHTGAGIGSVGFYINFTWGAITGNFNPSSPLIVPWWQGPTPAYKCTHYRTQAASNGKFVPRGTIELVQYTSGTYDDEYACT